MIDWVGPLWQRQEMPKRSSKPDVNQIAASILEAATGEPEDLTPKGEKNPAAVALGRLGGLKGGRARASALSPSRRAQIAKKAARARWKAKKLA
jgi:hypothetical protein